MALFDTIAALLAAFVIIPAMAVGGAELSSGGPGLMFIYLVNVFNGMAGGRVVEIIFFVCVLFAGVSSITICMRPLWAYLQEKFGAGRVVATGVILAIGCVVALCIQAIVSQWMDVVSIYICPLGLCWAASCFSGSPEKTLPLSRSIKVIKRRLAAGSIRWVSMSTAPVPLSL